MYCFKKAHHLRCKQDYDLVFKQACKITTSGFIVLYAQNTLELPRLGFAVHKKKLPQAYQRNRVRRLIKESFRMQQLPAIDIVFLVKHGIENLNNAELFVELYHIWEKIKN